MDNNSTVSLVGYVCILQAMCSMAITLWGKSGLAFPQIHPCSARFAKSHNLQFLHMAFLPQVIGLLAATLLVQEEVRCCTYAHTHFHTQMSSVFVELELVLKYCSRTCYRYLLEHKQLLYHSGNINRTCVYTRHSVVYLHEQMCMT